MYNTFYDDFYRWTKEIFLKAKTKAVRKLRDVLLLRGIYIVRNNQLIVNHLVTLLETEEIAL